MHDLDHDHFHPHTHEHGHTHSPEGIKAAANRLSRAIGRRDSGKQMVLDGRDCSEVLIQLSAVRSALNKAGMQIIQSHIEHCLVDAVQHGDTESVRELNQAIALYFK